MTVLPPEIGPLIARSLNLAQPFAQATVEAEMTSQVRIRRPLDNVYDRTAKTFTNPDDPIIYEGKAHFSDVTGGQTYSASGEIIPTTIATMQIPLSADRIFYGDTVELLVAKTDIKGRAQAKVAGLAGRVTGKSAPARSKAADRAASARSQVAGKSLMARQKAAAGRDLFQARAAGAWQATPEGFRRTATKGADTARQYRVSLAAGLVALGSGYLAFRLWPRR